jgi:hypothetical protein
MHQIEGVDRQVVAQDIVLEHLKVGFAART